MDTPVNESVVKTVVVVRADLRNQEFYPRPRNSREVEGGWRSSGPSNGHALLAEREWWRLSIRRRFPPGETAQEQWRRRFGAVAADKPIDKFCLNHVSLSARRNMRSCTCGFWAVAGRGLVHAAALLPPTFSCVQSCQDVPALSCCASAGL